MGIQLTEKEFRKLNISSQPVVRKQASQVTFFIPGEFTQLNDYIDAERGSMYAAADIKKKETARAENACDGVPALNRYPVNITFHWFRKDRRVDPDNIAFSEKFVLDGLVHAGILKDDGMHEISQLCHQFTIDRDNPGVEVSIISVSQKG